MLETVRHTIKQHNLIRARDTVIVGVSGGPDSMALIHALHALRSELQISLHIAHLDHMLRPRSGNDAAFVAKLGEKLGIPVTCRRVNVKALARKGSIEEAARTARLNFFLTLGQEIGAGAIALGHNLDDQAETVLMRLLRGTGLYGLAGILPLRTIDGRTIIRPLLEIKRTEIEAYLKKRRIKPLVDETNKDDIYFRNRIRNELLPLLERRYNKNIKAVLATLGECAGYDYDFLASAALKAARTARASIIDLAVLRAVHPSLRRIIIRNAIAAIQGNTRRITFQHIRELEDLIFNRPADSIVDLPKGVFARKTKTALSVCRRK